jgi:hypothetical protein
MADPGLIVKQVMELHTHADTARKAKEVQWGKNWALWNNEYDWRRKASWQSQRAIPKVPMLVDVASGRMAGALHTAGRYFAIEGHGTDAKQRAVAGEALTRDWLERREVRFPAQVAEGIRGAMLCATAVWKVRWDTQLRVDTIDPYDWWEDPWNRGRFVIHRSVRDYDQLLAMARNGDFDEEMVRAVSGDTGREETDAWRERAGLSEPAHASGRRSVEILELWGTIFDVTGEVIPGCEDCWCVIADRQHLIRPPEPNPLWHDGWPFIRVSPKPVPFAPYGKGLVDDVSDMAEGYTELWNLLYDAAMLDAIPIWEVNTTNLAYDGQLIRLAPGMQIDKNTPDPVLTPALKGHNGSQLALPVVSRWGVEIENQTGVTQDLMGHVGSGPRRTATEAMGQKQQSGVFLHDLGRTMEVDGIGPLADMAFRTIVQYMPSALYIAPRFRELLGNTPASILASMNNEQRYQYLCTQHTVRGRGVAGVFTRVEDLGRLLQFFQVVQMFPQLGALVKDDALMRKFIESLGWEADDIIITDPQEIAEKQQQMLMMQMAQQQMGQQPQLRGSSQGGPAWQNPVEQGQTRPRMVEGV